MSFRNPQVHRMDEPTKKIVKELRDQHYTVIHVGKPTDLLVTHGNWPRNTWRLLECKTPKGKKGLLKLRKDQLEQQDFCRIHEVPYVLTPAAALAYVQGYAP